MKDESTQSLLADIKRLLNTAREDYKQKNWNNHNYYVAELNKLLSKAKNSIPELEFEAIKEAEKDEIIHTSWSSGTPYDPKMKESFASKSKKMIEVINSADKLLHEVSLIIKETVIKDKDDFWGLVHPAIVGLTRSRFDAGHFADAVETAFKHINETIKNKVKKKTGKELDGAALMNTTFSPNNPILVLDDLSTETGKNIQQGYMMMFAGAMTGIRNPKAHSVVTIDKEEAIHLLFLASLLMHKYDQSI